MSTRLYNVKKLFESACFILLFCTIKNLVVLVKKKRFLALLKTAKMCTGTSLVLFTYDKKNCNISDKFTAKRIYTSKKKTLN